MSRKRFIKLLMSQGASRNLARRLADVVLEYNEKVEKTNHALRRGGLKGRYIHVKYLDIYATSVSIIWQMCENEEDVVHELR